MKEERPGYEWIATENGGFWKKIKGNAHRHKLDIFCPHCDKITGTIDDKCLGEYGICSECFVLYVEHRQIPAIDLSKYRKNSNT
jgi:hypothetical protein